MQTKPEHSCTKKNAHPGNRTLVSTVGGYYDTTTPDALHVFWLTIYVQHKRKIKKQS